jgi:hypothetical protein
MPRNKKSKRINKILSMLLSLVLVFLLLLLLNPRNVLEADKKEEEAQLQNEQHNKKT